MKKSFKKAVAVLLAVLMVAFSVPFTAFAAPGDYTPNLNLMFGTFHTDSVSDWQDYTVASGETFDYCGLYDVPLDYDWDKGTLTLSADKAAKACEVLGENGFVAPDEDITYGVGDYFTVTVTLENVKTVFAAMAQVKFSDNIEPAGYYNYQDGRSKKYALGTLSEANEAAASAAKPTTPTFTVGGTTPLENMSANYFYPNLNALGDLSKMDDSKNYWEDMVGANQPATDVSTTYHDLFANPETGDLSSGYTYEDTMVYQTWVFKITGEGPITFEPYDPYNTISPTQTFEGGYYIASNADGIMTTCYTTYVRAYGNYPSENAYNDPSAGPEIPGSAKMTIFGKNLNLAPTEPDQYTVKFVNAAGQTVSEQAYDAGTAASDVVVPANTAATSTDDGHTTYTWPAVADVTADVTYNEIANGPVAHDWVKDEEASTEPTCTVAGHYVYKCTVGGETYDEYPEATGHTAAEELANVKEATCTEPGYTGDVVCSVCGEVITPGEVIEAKGHTPVDAGNAKEATCTEPGYTGDTKCEVCGEVITPGEVIPAKGHDWGEWTVTKEPTYDEAGEETRTCKNDPSHVETRPIAALKGVSVTVEAVDLGTATVNDNAVTADDVTINVDTNSDVVLTATPIEGAEFVGWEVNGKIVSTEATYTAKALANIVYTPVFQLVEDEIADNEFTVIFADKFGNVVDAQTVTNGADIVVPAVPAIAGYNAIGWSLSDEEIDALTATTTITPVYERITEVTYTVTADGATITTPYATTEDVNTGIGYNTLVTVTAPGATAWKMGESTVAYGETYSFYIGTDMDLTPVYDVVEAAPTVASVSVTEITSNGMTGASFLATREMTDDCTYVNAGYIYGKDLADQEITLADVDGSTVKAIYCATDANQFALNYGITAQTGTIVARAFLAYVDAEGATQVVYAAPQTYAY